MFSAIMGGWKTWLGALTAILGGAAMIGNEIHNWATGQPVDTTKFAAGWAMISGGITAVGIGNKIEKGPVTTTEG